MSKHQNLHVIIKQQKHNEINASLLCSGKRGSEPKRKRDFCSVWVITSFLMKILNLFMGQGLIL